MTEKNELDAEVKDEPTAEEVIAQLHGDLQDAKLLLGEKELSLAQQRSVNKQQEALIARMDKRIGELLDKVGEEGGNGRTDN